MFRRPRHLVSLSVVEVGPVHEELKGGGLGDDAGHLWTHTLKTGSVSVPFGLGR